MNTSKSKAIEAIEKAWEIINDKQPETTEEINLVRFAVNTARQLISKPTLDDCIAVVEKIREYFFEHDRWVDCIEDGYPDDLRNKQYDILTALRGLKEGK